MNTSTKAVQAVHGAIKAIIEKSECPLALMALNGSRHGLCTAVRDFIMAQGAPEPIERGALFLWTTSVYDIHESWPEFSGEHRYPVPAYGYMGLTSPQTAYRMCSDKFGDHPYGQARLRLARYALEYFEGMLKL